MIVTAERVRDCSGKPVKRREGEQLQAVSGKPQAKQPPLRMALKSPQALEWNARQPWRVEERVGVR